MEGPAEEPPGPTKVRIVAGFYIFSVAPTGALSPKLVFEFPPDPEKKDPLGVKALSNLCFPYDDKSNAAITEQNFTLLYQASGMYGFCKQNQPATPASDSECLCLVSERNWHGFYPKVLDWLNHLRGNSRTRDDIGVVLEELFTERTLGDRLTLTFDSHPGLGSFDEAIPISHLRQLPRLDDTPNVALLVKALSTTNILKLFSSLLLERRILITSDKLATVTGISYGIMDLMFPLSWPHVTIPIMSKSLLDYACCPAPFIMGVHSSLVPILKSMPIEEHVFVDADNDQVIGDHADDDYRSIPLEQLGPLRSAVNKARDGKFHGTELSAAFVRFFAVLLGSYKEHLTDSCQTTELGKGGKIKSSRFVFDEEAFVEAHPKGQKDFVAKLLGYQAGDLFIQDRLLRAETPDAEDDVFEQAQRALEASPKYKWAHRKDSGGGGGAAVVVKRRSNRDGKQRPMTIHAGEVVSTKGKGPQRPVSVFVGKVTSSNPVAPMRKKKGRKAKSPTLNEAPSDVERHASDPGPHGAPARPRPPPARPPAPDRTAGPARPAPPPVRRAPPARTTAGNLGLSPSTSSEGPKRPPRSHSGAPPDEPRAAAAEPVHTGFDVAADNADVVAPPAVSITALSKAIGNPTVPSAVEPDAGIDDTNPFADTPLEKGVVAATLVDPFPGGTADDAADKNPFPAEAENDTRNAPVPAEAVGEIPPSTERPTAESTVGVSPPPPPRAEEAKADGALPSTSRAPNDPVGHAASGDAVAPPEDPFVDMGKPTSPLADLFADAPTSPAAAAGFFEDPIAETIKAPAVPSGAAAAAAAMVKTSALKAAPANPFAEAATSEAAASLADPFANPSEIRRESNAFDTPQKSRASTPVAAKSAKNPFDEMAAAEEATVGPSKASNPFNDAAAAEEAAVATEGPANVASYNAFNPFDAAAAADEAAAASNPFE